MIVIEVGSVLNTSAGLSNVLVQQIPSAKWIHTGTV